MASDHQLIVSAVGRPFKLGMLYDARTDKLLQGSALHDSEVLQRMTQRSLQPYSNFKMTASDSIQEKFSLLEVQASLRASILCGFVEGGGSAKYLHAERMFKNQCRVTLLYKAITHFEQLSLTSGDWESIQNKELIEQGQATHVVTGIEYGANTFFVFDSQVLEASVVHEYQINIKVVLNILFWSINLIDYDYHLTEEQTSLVEKLKVTFYSDFVLERNPATLIEALQIYTDMTKLLGENYQKAVPVKVWMMPLKCLNPKAAQLIRHINVGLVREAENTLQDLADIKMRCNECMLAGAVGKFTQLHRQLQTFHTHCHNYTVELRKKMAETYPAIREGKVQESILRSLFDERQSSPFSQEKLSKWLDGTERKITVVQSCLDIMRATPVLSTQVEVDRFLKAPENTACTNYIFTSLGNTDPLLEDMGRYLESLKMNKPYEPPVTVSDQPWYFSDEVVTKMREMAEAFNMLETQTSVFITAEHNDKHSGAAVVKYRDGESHV